VIFLTGSPPAYLGEARSQGLNMHAFSRDADNGSALRIKYEGMGTALVSYPQPRIEGKGS
jgi:hypothetical protein